MATLKTVRDYISGVRTMMKMTSADVFISDRTIAAEIYKTNLKYVLQRIDKREGTTSPTLFTTLDCICLEEVDIIECCVVETNCKIRKSIDPLPVIANSKNNSIIQGVWSLDKKFRYKEANPNRYANYLKIKPNSTEKFFWIGDNNHLYITDSNIEKVSISAFFEEPIDSTNYSCNGNTGCPINPLDLELKTLPKLKDDIINGVFDKLLSTFSRLRTDPNDDDISN